ncbi:hypothetical protein HOG16_02170 [Candidatus Woesearchaeota archaeon]|jgi:hypothetical protein|nr:hypothetical protein [Candidatus Woesearchaeota archaeon]MBT4321837.1 hypothetical protein [Candidatus Woesearchaeota archaeon]MBT4630611.1 hypothetical protein [Candidatus Woesearchaeota archaeon]
MNWKKETARDLLALGSIPFFILVMARSLVGEYYLFIFQTLIALVFIHFIGWKLDFNRHLARMLVLVFFTVLFYNQFIYSVFSVLVGLITLLSLFYLKEPVKKIGFGILLGVLASLLGYYLAPLI